MTCIFPYDILVIMEYALREKRGERTSEFGKCNQKLRRCGQLEDDHVSVHICIFPVNITPGPVPFDLCIFMSR